MIAQLVVNADRRHLREDPQVIQQAMMMVGNARWRDIPLPLRIVLALRLAVLVTDLTLRWVEPGYIVNELTRSVAAAADFAAQVMLAVGLFELAQRLVGGARRGAQIAWFAALF